MLRQMCVNHRARFRYLLRSLFRCFRYLLRSLFQYKIFWGACISGIWTVLNVKVDFAARWENCKSTLSVRKVKGFQKSSSVRFQSCWNYVRKGLKKNSIFVIITKGLARSLRKYILSMVNLAEPQYNLAEPVPFSDFHPVCVCEIIHKDNCRNTYFSSAAE